TWHTSDTAPPGGVHPNRGSGAGGGAAGQQKVGPGRGRPARRLRPFGPPRPRRGRGPGTPAHGPHAASSLVMPPPPDLTVWSEHLRSTLERYDESLLRRVATRLCKPRNQWPADELIERCLATV